MLLQRFFLELRIALSFNIKKGIYIILRGESWTLSYYLFGQYGLCDSTLVYSMNKLGGNDKKNNNNDNRQIFDASTIIENIQLFNFFLLVLISELCFIII